MGFPPAVVQGHPFPQLLTLCDAEENGEVREGTQLDMEMIRIWKTYSLFPNAVSKSLYKILLKMIGRKNARNIVLRWKQEKRP